MKLLIYMRDGRTVYRLVGRKNLGDLTRRKPENEADPVPAVKGIWNPTTGEYVWHARVRLRFLSAGSISHVEEDTYRAETT